MKETIQLKHRRAARWFHWTNFPLLALMLWSGILIYWANDIYRIDAGEYTIFRFFPRSWYPALGIDHRLAEGMAWHFFLQWFFVFNGMAFVAYTVVSGEWRELVPDIRSFRDAWHVVLHDLNARHPLPPQGKYNGAQRITYTLIILFGVLSTLTGYAIFKPVQLYWLRELMGGYEMARYIHFWLAIGYVLFFALHVQQVVRAGWNNFRAMVTGYELR